MRRRPDRLHKALSFIAEFYEEREDCEPEGSFFLSNFTAFKIRQNSQNSYPTVEFSVIGSGFKASMLVKCACTSRDSEIESLTSLDASLIELDCRKTRRRHRVTAALAPEHELSPSQ